MKNAILFLIFLTPFHLFSQVTWAPFDAQDYRIDSSSTQYASSPFAFFHTTKYHYDSVDRPILIESNDSVAEIEYGQQSETRRIIYNFNVNHEIRKIFDNRGNLLTETQGSINSAEIFEPYEIDSFWYNDNSKKTKYNSYRTSAYGPIPAEKTRYYYNENELIDSLVTKRISTNGEELSKERSIYEYNSDLQIGSLINKTIWNNVETISISDYSYNNKQLSKIHVRVYSGTTLVNEQIYHYRYTSNSMTEFFEDSDVLFGLDTTEITRYTYSSNPYLAYDTISKQVEKRHEIPHTETRWYTVEENESADSLVHKVTIKIEVLNDPMLRGGRITSIYSRKIPGNSYPPAGQIKLIPNPANAGSDFLLLAQDIDFDVVRVFTESGQILNSQRISQPINTYITAPNIPGLYFVQVYNDNKPVANAAKLVVL